MLRGGVCQLPQPNSASEALCTRPAVSDLSGTKAPGTLSLIRAAEDALEVRDVLETLPQRKVSELRRPQPPAAHELFDARVATSAIGHRI